MQLPYELAVHRVLPVLRAETARALRAQGMPPRAIAKAMGLAPAAVSQYSTAARGADEEVRRLFPELRDDARALAQAIARGAGEPEQAVLLDRIVQRVLRDARFCMLHRALEGLPECNVCFEPPFLGRPALVAAKAGEHA